MEEQQIDERLLNSDSVAAAEAEAAAAAKASGVSVRYWWITVPEDWEAPLPLPSGIKCLTDICNMCLDRLCLQGCPCDGLPPILACQCGEGRVDAAQTLCCCFARSAAEGQTMHACTDQLGINLDILGSNVCELCICCMCCCGENHITHSTRAHLQSSRMSPKDVADAVIQAGREIQARREAGIQSRQRVAMFCCFRRGHRSDDTEKTQAPKVQKMNR